MDFDLISAVIGLGFGLVTGAVFAMFRYNTIDNDDSIMADLHEEMYALKDLLEGAAQELYEAATQKTPRKR